MDASVVIPVKNGGERLKQVLEMIFQQETLYTFEVICVDSGSTDQSIDIINSYDCVLYQIPAKEFGHGKTRNLGASLGTGKYIVFLTQDALPTNVKWLDQMIKAMESDMQIAGGFGKHCPYPDCNYPDRLMLIEHFARFGDENYVFQLTDDNKKLYNEDEGYRQYLAFFSDNNSCLRRSVWEEIPYDDVDYAEDQFWARKILEKGYKKIYCPGAAVYHSHNYPLKSYAKRYYDDFKAVYSVYHTILCPDFRSYINGISEPVKKECRFICKQSELNLYKKMRWCMYSIIRNIMRCTSAVRAVKYYQVSEEKKEEMDRKYSQQYFQIHDK